MYLVRRILLIALFIYRKNNFKLGRKYARFVTKFDSIFKCFKLVISKELKIVSFLFNLEYTICSFLYSFKDGYDKTFQINDSHFVHWV